MSELKPCPACGKEPILVVEEDFLEDITRYRYKCPVFTWKDKGKSLEATWYETMAEAIEAWNKRSK